MITHSDSFVGALGKIRASGGSRAFTTPTTVDVPPEYSIGVDVQGELIANSLDGRLWIFRNDAGLGVVVLNWNASTGRLELSDVQAFAGSSDTVLARGIDWVLTNSRIFMASRSSPYVLCSDIFADDCPSSFLYSLLRKGSVSGSGTDPFTGEAWGKRNDNGNSGGEGYFLRDSHLLYPAGTHTFEQCYSVLPAVGEWQLFENFLVRRPDAPLSESYNGQLNVRPLIPLELKGGAPAFGTGYNFDHRGIELSCVNGVLWARGLYHIGRAYILPAVFDAGGNPLEFYLYIAQDFPCSPFLDGTVPYSFQEFGGHSFAVFPASLTWKQAKAACEDMGGHLATSTSAEKNSFLTNLAAGSTVWIGGTDEPDNGVWGWVTGETWSYTNWSSGEPNDYGGRQDFLRLYSNGTWDDDGANSAAPYICEWNEPTPTIDLPGAAWLNSGLLWAGNEALFRVQNQLQASFTDGIPALEVSGKLDSVDGNPSPDFSADNGKLFVDTLHSAALWLNSKGAQFLGADFIDCQGLPQWLAPDGNVHAVAGDFVLGGAGNSIVAVSASSGFHRQKLSRTSLPLSVGYYETQAAIEASENGFSVNTLRGAAAAVSPLDWSSVFRQTIRVDSVRLLPFDESYDDYPDTLYADDDYSYFLSGVLLTYDVHRGAEDSASFVYNTIYKHDTRITVYEYCVCFCNVDGHTRNVVVAACHAKCWYLDLVSGSIRTFSVSVDCHPEGTIIDDTPSRKWLTYAEVPRELAVVDGKLGFYIDTYDYRSCKSSRIFREASGVPEGLLNSIKRYGTGYYWAADVYYYRELGEGVINCPVSSSNRFHTWDANSISWEGSSGTLYVSLLSCIHSVPYVYSYSVNSEQRQFLSDDLYPDVYAMPVAYFPDSSGGIFEAEGYSWASNFCIVFRVLKVNLKTQSTGAEFLLILHVSYSPLVLDHSNEVIFL